MAIFISQRKLIIERYVCIISTNVIAYVHLCERKWLIFGRTKICFFICKKAFWANPIMNEMRLESNDETALFIIIIHVIRLNLFWTINFQVPGFLALLWLLFLLLELLPLDVPPPSFELLFENKTLMWKPIKIKD